MISNESVQELYNKCVVALPSTNMDPQFKVTQFFRGVTSIRWKSNPHPCGCVLNINVFKHSQIIPETCFSCFKVLVVPRTVVELFKLMMVFESMDLPNNNSRKCMVEKRPGISGAYKGYVLCQSLDEAREILNITRALVTEEISVDVSVSLKRGCSEYPEVYPEYNNLGTEGEPLMNYREEWREKEKAVEDIISKKLRPIIQDSFDHPGFDQNDTLAMCAWIAYAAAIGDSSYLAIIPLSIVHPMPNLHRPAYKVGK